MRRNQSKGPRWPVASDGVEENLQPYRLICGWGRCMIKGKMYF